MVFICKKVYASPLQKSGFISNETIGKNYPKSDFHTMYVGKIEKILVKDEEYLNK
ncbi:hypothetical protein LPYR103PRE_08150 [Segatella asaccharophila]